MRRTTALFGTLTAAALIGVGLPGTAAAAQGTLWIDGEPHQNPSGCNTGVLEAEDDVMEMDNDTDEPAYLFEEEECQGEAFDVLEPGEEALVYVPASIGIP